MLFIEIDVNNVQSQSGFIVANSLYYEYEVINYWVTTKNTIHNQIRTNSEKSISINNYI